MIKSKNKLKKLMINMKKKKEMMSQLNKKNKWKKKHYLISLKIKLRNIIKIWPKD